MYPVLVNMTDMTENVLSLSNYSLLSNMLSISLWTSWHLVCLHLITNNQIMVKTTWQKCFLYQRNQSLIQKIEWSEVMWKFFFTTTQLSDFKNKNMYFFLFLALESVPKNFPFLLNHPVHTNSFVHLLVIFIHQKRRKNIK